MCPGSGPGPAFEPAVIRWWFIAFSEQLLGAGHSVSKAQSMGEPLLREVQSNNWDSDQGSRAMESEVAVMISQKEVSSLQAHFTGGKTESLSQGWIEAELAL